MMKRTRLFFCVCACMRVLYCAGGPQTTPETQFWHWTALRYHLWVETGKVAPCRS